MHYQKEIDITTLSGDTIENCSLWFDTDDWRQSGVRIDLLDLPDGTELKIMDIIDLIGKSELSKIEWQLAHTRDFWE